MGYDPSESLQTFLVPPLADWHPPLYGALMGGIYLLGIYPPIILNGISLLMTSGGVWCLYWILSKRYRLAWLIILLLPALTLMRFGTVHGKDDLMMGFLLISLACVFAIHSSMDRRKLAWLLSCETLCCMAVIALRHNGVLLAFALIFTTMLRLYKSGNWWKPLLVSITVPFLMLVGIHLGTKAFIEVRQAHPLTQQMIRDIVAIERLKGTDSNFLAELPDMNSRTVQLFAHGCEREANEGHFGCLMDHLVQGIGLMPMTDRQADTLTQIWLERIKSHPLEFSVARGIFMMQHCLQAEVIPEPIRNWIQGMFPRCRITESVWSGWVWSIVFGGMLLVSFFFFLVALIKLLRDPVRADRERWINILTASLLVFANFTAYMIVPQGIVTRYMWPSEVGMFLLLVVAGPVVISSNPFRMSCGKSFLKSLVLFTLAFVLSAVCIWVHYRNIIFPSPRQGMTVLEAPPGSCLMLEKNVLRVCDAPFGRFGYYGLDPLIQHAYSAYSIKRFSGEGNVFLAESHDLAFCPQMPLSFLRKLGLKGTYYGNYSGIVPFQEIGKEDILLVERRSMEIHYTQLFKYEMRERLDYMWKAPQEKVRQVILPLCGGSLSGKVSLLKSPEDEYTWYVGFVLEENGEGNEREWCRNRYVLHLKGDNGSEGICEMQHSWCNDPGMIHWQKPGTLYLSGRTEIRGNCPTIESMEVYDEKNVLLYRVKGDVGIDRE
ncbi:hypothetical protein [Akkermansia sp.]|uniref:hypothetical protein n=1 Tax=Akkermansia sp. TaxID=1872421 RepID=UPI0025BCC51E|nr:hypothetical protein [Akkermansia sp.]MCC8148082.1 hypothetical protein [Akkermansia sp.]